jgi:NADH:ubiquinone reductase (H+-translocating)
MYAALNAARLRDKQGLSPDDLEIVVVAPEPRLVIRPRLYEPAPETMVAPLADVLDAVDVRYEQGMVDVIDSAGK